VTLVKGYGWAAAAGVALATCGLYYAATAGLAGPPWQGEHLHYLALALVAALCSALLALFWRNVHRAAGGLSRQLESMARTRQVTTVQAGGNDDLMGVAQSVNHALVVVREEIDRLREESRELQIQSRIVDAEKKHAEAIVISISDAVVVTNRFDELILANQGAEELLGFTLEGGLRKNIDDTLHD
jgi:signal transduction histidine kinase